MSPANDGATHNAVESMAGSKIEVASFFIDGLSQKQSARSRTQSRNLVEIVFGVKYRSIPYAAPGVDGKGGRAFPVATSDCPK
jgi:hypothetical protein